MQNHYYRLYKTHLQQQMHNTFTEHFPQEINLDVETYIDALKISQRGLNVILKRNPKDVFINACNHDILSLWRVNVDLQ